MKTRCYFLLVALSFVIWSCEKNEGTVSPDESFDNKKTTVVADTGADGSDEGYDDGYDDGYN